MSASESVLVYEASLITEIEAIEQGLTETLDGLFWRAAQEQEWRTPPGYDIVSAQLWQH